MIKLKDLLNEDRTASIVQQAEREIQQIRDKYPAGTNKTSMDYKDETAIDELENKIAYAQSKQESVNEDVSPKGWNMSKKYIKFIEREVKNLKKYHMQQNEEDFLEVANYIELQLKQMKKDLNESVNERTDSQAKKNLMRALKNSKVADVFSYDNNQIAIEMTNGDDYIVGNIQSYNPNESINEANIKDIEKVLKTRSAKKIDGMYMDMTTANAIMTVWKALNTSNRKKFEKLPLKKMVDVTWKLVK